MNWTIWAVDGSFCSLEKRIKSKPIRRVMQTISRIKYEETKELKAHRKQGKRHKVKLSHWLQSQKEEKNNAIDKS